MPKNQTTSHNVSGRPKMDKNMTSKTQNRVKLDPFGCFEGNPKKTPIWKGFDPDPKSWTKTDPKMVKKRSKMTKIGSNLGFGVKVGDFWAKGTVGTPKMSQRPFSGFENWFWQGFWQEVRPIAGNPEFPGLVWKGWRVKFGRMIFVTKMKNQYENFWWTKLGKNENNVIFFVTNEKYGNYFDSSLRWPILPNLSLVSLKSLMNEF